MQSCILMQGPLFQRGKRRRRRCCGKTPFWGRRLECSSQDREGRAVESTHLGRLLDRNFFLFISFSFFFLSFFPSERSTDPAPLRYVEGVLRRDCRLLRPRWPARVPFAPSWEGTSTQKKACPVSEWAFSLPSWIPPIEGRVCVPDRHRPGEAPVCLIRFRDLLAYTGSERAAAQVTYLTEIRSIYCVAASVFRFMMVPLYQVPTSSAQDGAD